MALIDALFGSKTRVKLLHLFLNNPNKSFYVREITRLIDEQINSVRRELSNMLGVGIITSDTAENKLYYEVNQRYEYFVPLRAIFADGEMVALEDHEVQSGWTTELANLAGVRIALASGVLVPGSQASVDLLVAGDVRSARLSKLVKEIEKSEGREINYSLMSYDDFYYRLSVRDRFITQILNQKHRILVDTDELLNRQK